MRHIHFAASANVGVAVLAFSTVSAAPPNEKLSIPAGFDHWYLVNSMIVTKDSPVFDAIGGLHHIYINAVGLPRLKMGGSAPYPDGTIFADDVRDFVRRDPATDRDDDLAAFEGSGSFIVVRHLTT